VLNVRADNGVLMAFTDKIQNVMGTATGAYSGKYVLGKQQLLSK
jgi:hypothetical protein